MSLTLWQLDTEAHDLLLSCLSTRDLFALLKVSKGYHRCVSAYSRRAYRIEKVLGRYFSPDEITAFRVVQFETGALISGSTALQFFDRSFYPESDLDIYVEHSFALQVAQFLLEIGYKCFLKDDEEKTLDVKEELRSIEISCRFSTGVYDDMPGISGVVNFMRCDQRIQLVTTLEYSTLYVVLNFHSTVVMNFISHSAAYSAYPKASFIDRTACTTGDSEEFDDIQRATAAIEKYRRRGWNFPDVKSRDSVKWGKCNFDEGFRHVGDASCWVISLQPIVAPSISANDVDPTRINSWNLDFNDFDGHYCMSAGAEVLTPRTMGGAVKYCFTISTSLPSAHWEMARILLPNVEIFRTKAEECVEQTATAATQTKYQHYITHISEDRLPPPRAVVYAPYDHGFDGYESRPYSAGLMEPDYDSLLSSFRSSWL